VAQFRYRLQALLDQKGQAKKEAEHSLADAQRELRTTQEELEACRREQDASAGRLRRARAERVSSVIGGSSGEEMRWRRDYIGRLLDEYKDATNAMRAQELSVSEAEDRVAAAREMLASRSRDVEVLEKHKAKLERRFNDDAARKEALDQEEMANVIFLQGQRAK
jgi:flagellar biosynthesis chaperone FliJ